MKNNKLIAEFMGVEKTYNPSTEKVLSYAVNDDVQCLPHELQYHTSWDWLMPVVAKILDNAFYDIGLTSMEDFYSIKENIPYMDETYKSVVEFIKTYNDVQTLREDAMFQQMDNLPPHVQ